MAAYNWIIVDDICPACGQLARIECQTHVASSFSGDVDGRFCHEQYRLGEKMRWWEPGHREYAQWRVDRRLVDPVVDPRATEEACYSSCLSCNAELVVIVRYRDLIPVEVLGISPESEWPEGYYK